MIELKKKIADKETRFETLSLDCFSHFSHFVEQGVRIRGAAFSESAKTKAPSCSLGHVMSHHRCTPLSQQYTVGRGM